jgi:hypothetical protein
VNDTSKYTYLTIKVKIKNQPAITKEYKLILGEGLQYNSSKFMKGEESYTFPNGSTHERDALDLSIRRNTHYVISASIQNFGLSGDQELTIRMKVEDWVFNEMEPPDIWDFTFNISQSYFKIPANHTGVVRIETDHQKGWEANVVGDLYLNDSPTIKHLERQGSGPLKFTATNSGTHYIDVTVGSVTKRIKVEATP